MPDKADEARRSRKIGSEGRLVASGHSNQLTRQIGEHLVAAELGRRGYIATPFAGNVPLYDLLVANIDGRAIPIQVKAIRGGAWQFSADQFLDIEFSDGQQAVRGRKTLVHPGLLCVFVVLKEAGLDEFYLFHLRDLQDHCERVYKPRKHDSRHCAVTPKQFKDFRDKWALLEEALLE